MWIAGVVVAVVAVALILWTRPKPPPPAPPAPRTDAPPVPWIATDVWASSDVEDDEVLTDVFPYEVSEAEHAAAPRSTLSIAPVAEGDEAAWDDAVDRSPDVLACWNPMPWPVCCRRLTTVVGVNPTRAALARLEAAAGPLDKALLEDDPSCGWSDELANIRRGEDPENGVNLFQCSGCGAMYGVYSHT